MSEPHETSSGSGRPWLHDALGSLWPGGVAFAGPASGLVRHGGSQDGGSEDGGTHAGDAPAGGFSPSGVVRFSSEARLAKHEALDACEMLSDAEAVLARLAPISRSAGELAARLVGLVELIEGRLAVPAALPELN